jgi:hypothetical protein
MISLQLTFPCVSAYLCTAMNFEHIKHNDVYNTPKVIKERKIICLNLTIMKCISDNLINVLNNWESLCIFI